MIEHPTAAEFVGIATETATSARAAGARVRFVPGGATHALVSPSTTACGLPATALEVFATEFAEDRWGLRCASCAQALRLA